MYDFGHNEVMLFPDGRAFFRMDKAGAVLGCLAAGHSLLRPLSDSRRSDAFDIVLTMALE